MIRFDSRTTFSRREDDQEYEDEDENNRCQLLQHQNIDTQVYADGCDAVQGPWVLDLKFLKFSNSVREF